MAIQAVSGSENMFAQAYLKGTGAGPFEGISPKPAEGTRPKTAVPAEHKTAEAPKNNAEQDISFLDAYLFGGIHAPGVSTVEPAKRTAGAPKAGKIPGTGASLQEQLAYIGNNGMRVNDDQMGVNQPLAQYVNGGIAGATHRYLA